MRKFFITIHDNRRFKYYYENLHLECTNADILFHYRPNEGLNVFTEFVYQFILKDYNRKSVYGKDFTREKCAKDFPIVNIFELCM